MSYLPLSLMDRVNKPESAKRSLMLHFQIIQFHWLGEEIAGCSAVEYLLLLLLYSGEGVDSSSQCLGDCGTP